MIRVVIVDDHALVRTGIAAALSSADDIEIVGLGENGQEAVELAGTIRPDVILMDISMPVLGGVEATAPVLAASPTTKVVMLTTFSEPNRVNAALAAGASGYLLKDVEPSVLIAGLRSLASGGAPLSPQISAQLIRTAPKVRSALDALTPREASILALLAQGFGNKQIARSLVISEKTVKAHCTRIFQRIGVTDRTAAAVWATKHLPIEHT